MRLRIDRGVPRARSLLRSYHLQAHDGGRMRDRPLLQRLQGKTRRPLHPLNDGKCDECLSFVRIGEKMFEHPPKQTENIKFFEVQILYVLNVTTYEKSRMHSLTASFVDATLIVLARYIRA